MGTSTTVKQSAVDNMQLLGGLLPMMSTAAMEEVATQLSNLISQNSQNVTSNAQAITALQAQVAELPALGDTERAEVITLIAQEMSNLNVDPSFNVNYQGDSVDGQAFLQMVATQQARKPVGVAEVTRSPEGYVTSAKVMFDDATEQTVTFTRSTNAKNTIATYLGSIPDGNGGVTDGYEYRLRIGKFEVPGLVLSSTWDGDLVSQRLFISNVSLSFTNLTEEDEPGSL